MSNTVQNLNQFELIATDEILLFKISLEVSLALQLLSRRLSRQQRKVNQNLMQIYMNIKQTSILAYYADPHSQSVNRTQSARYSSRSSSSITVKTPRDALIGFPSFSCLYVIF